MVKDARFVAGETRRCRRSREAGSTTKERGAVGICSCLWGVRADYQEGLVRAISQAVVGCLETEKPETLQD